MIQIKQFKQQNNISIIINGENKINYINDKYIIQEGINLF